MKIKLDIDCTPEEARTFCGLPDVSQLNDLMVEEMKKRMSENMAAMEPDALMQNWASVGGQMQDQFFALMRQAAEPKKD